jgi:hypothetical protein
MRIRSALVALTLVVLFSVDAAAADAQKGGPSTVLNGGRGVVAPNGKVRYVALTTGQSTIVSFVRIRGGQVLGWRQLRGYFGVPQVALDGTTDGISRDGRTLVLATPAGAGTPSGGATTRFALLDTKTLRLRRLTFPGTWSYDAISPDGSVLYLVEYASYGPSVSYKVRAYDTSTRKLLARPIVDGDIGERLMRGWAVTRKTTSDGRWAYTLYARAKHEPFVHALDTERRQAYCIDIPLDLTRSAQMGLRLALRGDRTLEVRQGSVGVATIDTRTFVVHGH